MGVTYSRKRYISKCLACGGLFDAVRKDQVTCSAACRVNAHRHKLRQKVERDICQGGCSLRETPVDLWQQFHAAFALCPSIKTRIMADGDLNLDDFRNEIAEAFDKYIIELLNAIEAES